MKSSDINNAITESLAVIIKADKPLAPDEAYNLFINRLGEFGICILTDDKRKYYKADTLITPTPIFQMTNNELYYIFEEWGFLEKVLYQSYDSKPETNLTKINGTLKNTHDVSVLDFLDVISFYVNEKYDTNSSEYIYNCIKTDIEAIGSDINKKTLHNSLEYLKELEKSDSNISHIIAQAFILGTGVRDAEYKPLEKLTVTKIECDLRNKRNTERIKRNKEYNLNQVIRACDDFSDTIRDDYKPFKEELGHTQAVIKIAKDIISRLYQHKKLHDINNATELNKFKKLFYNEKNDYYKKINEKIKLIVN